MPAIDESASAIVEVLMRLDLRLGAIEAKVDAILAVMRRPAPAGDSEPAKGALVYDRRQAPQPFDGMDRRMGEI